MLLILVTSMHVIAAAILIMFILLHAGRGGGLSDMFGGGMSLGGSTMAEKNLDRMTVFAAGMFIVTTISLGFIMADRDRAPEPSTPLPSSIPTDAVPLPTDGASPDVSPSPTS